MKIRRIVFCFALILTVTLIGSTALTGKTISKYPGVTVRTLASGAPLHGHNGLIFGPDQNLYLASVGGNEIIKMDPHSGRILDRIGPEHGVSSPDDLTFGPDGSLYWTAIFAGDVGKLAPDGTHSTLVNLGLGVNPITFSPDNRWLYVARDFLGKGLYRIDPDDGSSTVLLPDIENLNAFDFGPDGRLYGPIYGMEVVVIDVNATPPSVETVLEDIVCSAVKFDSRGRMLTNNGGEVIRYDIRTGKKEVLANLPFLVDNIATDLRDQVYVSGDGIAKILPNRNYIMLSPGGMLGPNGVAVLPRRDGGESVYVSDIFSLYEFDGRTGTKRSLAAAGVLSGGLTTYLGTLAVDGDNLIVSSALTGLIQRWDPLHQEVLNFWYDPNMPQGAMAFGQDIVVTELLTGQVVRFTPGGRESFAQLAMPVGLATDGTNLWVADYALGQVFRILPDFQPVAASLQGPSALAFYPPDGSLLVIEANPGRLSRIDPATGNVTVLAEGLQAAYGIPMAYSGVAVGASGAIYVSALVTNELYRIEIH